METKSVELIKYPEEVMMDSISRVVNAAVRGKSEFEKVDIENFKSEQTEIINKDCKNAENER